MLNLYVLDNCPYCKKVINYLQENNIEYCKINIEDKNNEEQLIKLGGKRQVPFLEDKKNNVLMYESDSIIKYINSIAKNY